MKTRAVLLACLFGMLQAGLLRPQAIDVDRELEEAKALYREAKFAQAVAKLQGTIVRLEQLRDLQARRIQLSDAHLHLALSYVAFNDPSAAKESLKQMLRVDRNRKLDPDIYAPKVIELFEEARKEVAAEPTAAATPPPSATAKKGGSKTPLVLLGAAAAAGGGIAVAKGGGSSTGTTPTAAATPTPTPTPVVSGPDDIVLLQLEPPPGSTIRLVAGPVLFTMRVSVVYSRTGTYSFAVTTVHSGPPATARLGNRDFEIVRLTAGEARTFVFPMVVETVAGLRACPSPPFSTHTIGVTLYQQPENRSVLTRAFAAGYQFTQ